ncbi:MAG: hypothetical protein QW035_01595 [Candidatus Anstonellales archaeon]
MEFEGINTDVFKSGLRTDEYRNTLLNVFVEAEGYVGTPGRKNRRRDFGLDERKKEVAVETAKQEYLRGDFLLRKRLQDL